MVTTTAFAAPAPYRKWLCRLLAPLAERQMVGGRLELHLMS
jgi:hypothetical protein